MCYDISFTALWEEKSIQEIAEELGISIGKTRLYFQRGLFHLQKNTENQSGQHKELNRIVF
ncbi:MAG TPA: hypothetical protein VK772_11730 [Puia sp.]|jgi:DNA-directed RNA polymerase specialized sigma24 family protein|nr:hypothetical protein [Puia sp.]